MKIIDFKYKNNNKKNNNDNIFKFYKEFQLLGYNDEQIKFILSCIIYNNIERYKHKDFDIKIKCIKYDDLPEIYKENINRQIIFDTIIYEENNNEIKIKMINTYNINNINADFILNDETRISFIVDIENKELTEKNKEEIINKCLKINNDKEKIIKIINDIVELTIKYKKYPSNKFIITIYKSCLI